MTKRALSTILLVLLSFESGFCQFKKENFILKGSIKGIPDGKAIHLSTGYIRREAADWTQEADSAIISDGKFLFKSSIAYPHGVRIYYDDKNIHFQSGLFFIEKGLQTVSIDVDLQNGKTPVLKGSSVNDVYIKKYHVREIQQEEAGLMEKAQNLFRQFNGDIPESEKVLFYKKREEYHFRMDSFLLHDTKNGPSYFISLWLVTEYLQKYGYKSIYRKVFNLLPAIIRRTKTGRFFNNELKEASSTQIGKIFPALNLVDTMNNSKIIAFNTGKAKYTLIDFWFSYCHPCIVQFPKLKELYEQYRNKGFQIIGISIDAKKDKGEWLKAIEKHKLPWEQFLDIDHFEAERLSVSAYPTTFLLGSDGKIISRNLELSQLEDFLKRNLQ